MPLPFGLTAADLAAYIGAAAWLPQIVGWVRDSVTAAKLTVLPQPNVEIGFTTYGPIFNLRMAFSADSKDAIIDGFELKLTHEDGEARTLRWVGLGETFSEIRDDSGNRQVVSRDEVPVAIKVGTESLVVLNVRFQEPRYSEANTRTLADLVNHFTFLKQGNPDKAVLVSKTLESKEFHVALKTRQDAFWWRPGHYTVEMKLSSPAKLKVTNRFFVFSLATAEVERVRRNLASLKVDLENTVNSNLPDFTPESVSWNWTYPDISMKGETALTR